MKIGGNINILSESEIDLICENSNRVLSEIGIRVENEWLVDILCENGAVKKDSEKSTVIFPLQVISDFYGSSEPYVENENEKIRFIAGANPQFYMKAGSDRVRENSISSMKRLIILADHLECVDIMGIMGVPSDVETKLTPLYTRLFNWKYAVNTENVHCREVWDDESIDYVDEMIEVYADDIKAEDKTPMKNIIVYMISPYSFKAQEANRLENCYKKGYHVYLSSLCSSGGTAPIMIAGALVQNLAEHFFFDFVERMLYGTKTLSISNRIGIMDMKYGIFPYGRPEIGVFNMAVSQLAQHFKASYSSNSFSAEAKIPSCEAGMQKALSAITGIIAGSKGFGTLGLLSVDEIVSEEQLVIDNEFALALRHMAKTYEISQDTIDFDVMKEVGIGGQFTSTDQTFKNFREEHWQPKIFSAELYDKWTKKGSIIDRKLAADIVGKILNEKDERYGISSDCEKRLKKIIKKASQLYK